MKKSQKGNLKNAGLLTEDLAYLESLNIDIDDLMDVIGRAKEYGQLSDIMYGLQRAFMFYLHPPEPSCQIEFEELAICAPCFKHIDNILYTILPKDGKAHKGNNKSTFTKAVNTLITWDTYNGYHNDLVNIFFRRSFDREQSRNIYAAILIIEESFHKLWRFYDVYMNTSHSAIPS